ncbi:DUF2927 domain-containing protein [Chachezhania sediminis]|uniref:DUF2927 domain-containing protein n=1 Tax=Chachezhania sediminis TaxID=2599291 RepID=UPI001E3BB003|nr:DUF2927 domain-containing protein [Chachezhania sediminis]
MTVHRFGLVTALLAMAVGCDLVQQAPAPSPHASPQSTARPAPSAERTEPSPESRKLAAYYAGLQQDRLTRGLLRVDGGGPDTAFTARDLATNFEAIAFYNEYSRGGVSRSRQDAGWLTRWVMPVRIEMDFGPSVPDTVRRTDRDRLNAYVRRLARLTGQPVTTTGKGGNFVVFVAGIDDTDFVVAQLRRLVPGITDTELDLFRDLPRDRYCQVLTYPVPDRPYLTVKGVALIRAEQPDLLRRACLHEELAQGLGLRNDSPSARPSIFNDDDEFALLTTHDEFLLEMLYDPRLTPGMTAAEARPSVEAIALEKVPPRAF